MQQEIKIKRAYTPATPEDGYRVFIDRLWPRGLTHQTFPYNLWDKAIAPSVALRKWWHSAPAQTLWPQFQTLYMAELMANPSLPQLYDIISPYPTVTLLYPCRDPECNIATVVRRALLQLKK